MTIYIIAEMSTKWLKESVYSIDKQERDYSLPGRIEIEMDGVEFYENIQNGVQIKW